MSSNAILMFLHCCGNIFLGIPSMFYICFQISKWITMKMPAAILLYTTHLLKMGPWNAWRKTVSSTPFSCLVPFGWEWLFITSQRGIKNIHFDLPHKSKWLTFSKMAQIGWVVWFVDLSHYIDPFKNNHERNHEKKDQNWPPLESQRCSICVLCY